MAYTNFSWIDDHLAIGGLVVDSDEIPFDAVLSMETAAPLAVRELARSGTVDYRWFSIIDGYCWEEHDDHIVRRFDDAAALLHAWICEGKRILVHCASGVSRSVTAAAWYLIRYRGMTWDEAMALIQARRPQANPNIRLEVVLRIAGGEKISEDWLEERVNQYRRRPSADYGVITDPREIWDDLERQGTRRHVMVSLI